MKTSPTNKKVRELINMVKEKKLVPRPDFQRRLVWSREDKNHFLDSVIRGYPFPEIYFADGDVNLETGEGTQLLVDGLQRIHTLIQYFDGDPELKLLSVLPYNSLIDDDKKAFLQYDVAVRDLGSISKEEIIEVFKRLNATKYSLLDIEINNAVYAGALKKYCDNIADLAFFTEHQTFNSLDYKRMGDLRFVLGIISTMIQGYTNRDDAFEAILDRYNDDFPYAVEFSERLKTVFDFINECGFDAKSRLWKKADLFTIIVELDQILNIKKTSIQPSHVLDILVSFFQLVDNSISSSNTVASLYYKAALQASNDKINRIRRGQIISDLLSDLDFPSVEISLRSNGLL